MRIHGSGPEPSPWPLQAQASGPKISGKLIVGCNGSVSEVAGDFYLIITMMIVMIIIILHHGADDYNHMAMQGDSQLGIHEGGN